MRFHLEILDENGVHQCGSGKTCILICKDYTRTSSYRILKKTGRKFRVRKLSEGAYSEGTIIEEVN